MQSCRLRRRYAILHRAWNMPVQVTVAAAAFPVIQSLAALASKPRPLDEPDKTCQGASDSEIRFTDNHKRDVGTPPAQHSRGVICKREVSSVLNGPYPRYRII